MLRLMSAALLAAALALTPGPTPLADADLPTLGSGGASVSLDQEHRLGRAWLRQFRAQTAAWQDPIARHYVESIVARLLPYSDIGDTRTVVTLVDSRLLNAFAVPGGVIGVNAGLFTFAADESAFASVLAHELGHLSQRHFARRMERMEETRLPTMAAMLAGMVLAAGGAGNAGMAAMMGSQAAFIQDQLAYSRRFEQEADRVGLKAMANAGFNPQAMPAMFQAMQRLTSLQGGNPPEFLLTHPVTESRIGDTQSRADQLSSPSEDTDPTYTLIRARALLELNERDPAQARTQLRQDQAGASALAYLDALIAARQNRTDAALAALDRLAGELPDLSLIPASAAEIALAAGRYDQALERTRKILRLSPDYFPARLLRAEALLQRDPARAYDVLRELGRRAPEEPQVQSLLAEAAGRSGHPVWGHLARAEWLQLTGHIDRAIRQLDVAEDVAKGANDFGMASRIQQRRQVYLDYREAAQQL